MTKKKTILCECTGHVGGDTARCSPMGSGVLPTFDIPDALMECVGMKPLQPGQQFIMHLDTRKKSINQFNREFAAKQKG